MGVIPSICYLVLSISAAEAQSKVNKQNSFTSENLRVLDNSDNPSHYKNSMAMNQISIKAIRDFKKTYENINNEKWYLEAYGFCAVFFEGDIRNDVNYSDNGHWLYSMKQYDETKLCRDIRNQIKTIYYDYAIQWVHEIILPKKTVYFVLIEDKTTLKNIRICEDELEIIEDINKN